MSALVQSAALACSFEQIVQRPQDGEIYVSGILRLALLAPDIVEAVLGGWADQRVMLGRLEWPLPKGWEEQRRTVARSRSATANR